MTKTEAELIEELKGGEPQAFREFAQRYGSRIYDVQCWLCGDTTEAEDLAQETVVAVFKGIGKFRGGSTLYTWVYRIAHRIASRHLSEKANRNLRFDDVSEIQAPGDIVALAGSSILRDRIREALKALPVAQREAVVMHCLQGLSHTETARALDRPLGTVKWQIAQGLHALRNALGGDVDAL